MSVSAASATYRVRIAAQGATSIGTPDLTLTQDDVTEVPILSGPSTDVLACRTVSHPFQIRCKVDTPVFVSSGRLAVLGRLCEIQRDVGAGFVTIGTGRISHVSEMDGRGRVTIEVSDERWVERRTQIFRTTDSVQLYPTGLASAWMDRPAAGTATFTVAEVSGQAYRIVPGSGLVLVPAGIPAAFGEALIGDLLRSRSSSASNSAGNFTSLRFNDGSGDRVVISFRQSLTGVDTGALDGNGLLGPMAPGEASHLYSAWIYHNGHGHSPNDEITGRFYFPSGVAISEKMPLHIGGASGIHPMTLLKDILDGDYGGQAVLYDSTAMTALTGMSLRRVWLRITEPSERSEWLAKNLYPVYAVAPLVGTDLAFRPTALRFPQDVDPDTLEVLTASNAEVTPWEHTSRELATVLSFRAKSVRPLSQVANRTEDWAVDDYEPVDGFPIEFQHDTAATLGEIVHAIETDLIFANWRRSFVEDVPKELSVDIFDVFGDGPMRGSATVRDNVDVQVGDLAVLDHDTLKGFNPGTGDRTGDRVVRFVGFRERHPTHTVFDWLDMGPKSAPLDAPTISIAQHGTDLDLVEVTISNLNAGESAIVECTAAASTPTEFEHVRAGVGNETVTFNLGAASGNAYARARATAPHRIRSAWATDDVALTTRARITKAECFKGASDADVTWEVPSGTAGIRATYDIHDRGTAPTLANQADYDATDGGFTITGVPTRSMVTVQLTPYPGFSGGSVSGTAGDPVIVQSVFPRTRPGGGIPTVRGGRPSIRTTFDANGEAVVSLSGPEEAVAMYVTVGDGTDPSDPTASVNDGEVTGPSGTVDTGVAITTGNDAHVKAVWEDSYGNLSLVGLEKAARRQGPFDKDISTRSHTGDTTLTTLETLTVPANVLGADGGFELEMLFLATGTAGLKTVRVFLGSTEIGTYIMPAAAATRTRGNLLVFNVASASSQRGAATFLQTGQSPSVANLTAAEDTTSDVDILIRVQLANAADQVDLLMHYLRLIGTD